MGAQLRDSNWALTQNTSHLGGRLLFGALERAFLGLLNEDPNNFVLAVRYLSAAPFFSSS